MDVLLNTRLLTYDIKVRQDISGWVRYLPYRDRTTLGVVVSNLIACLRKGNVLVYSRDTSSRRGVSKKHITPTKVIKAVDFLEKEGYVVNHIGVSSRIREHRVISWIEPTCKFIEKWGDEEIKMTSEQDYLDTCSVVELRDSDKKAIPYRNSSHIKRMSETVRELNRLNEKSVIKDGDGRVLTNIYCRIFNESFDYGGRFYRADVLAIKNKTNNERLDITIDGQSVVEVDYSNLHFRIAAAMRGLNMEDIPLDVYSGILDDENNVVDRRIVKLAVNIMFNCFNEESAEKAINSEINKLDNESRGVYTLGKAKSVMLLIYDAYVEFSDIFCSGEGYGRVLQNADSHLASDILEIMIGKGIPCLPVHDSFIVSAEHLDFLCDTMGQCFRKRFNYDGIVPVGISWKQGGVKIEEKVAI